MRSFSANLFVTRAKTTKLVVAPNRDSDSFDYHINVAARRKIEPSVESLEVRH